MLMLQQHCVYQDTIQTHYAAV